MNYTVRVLAHNKRGSPLEDLGVLPVTPKPERSELVHFQYKGREAVGMVTLIDPHNWEKRPELIPTIHVQLSEDFEPHN